MSVHVFLSFYCLLKILGGLMKWVLFQIKGPKNGLIMVIFKLLVLSYVNTTLYFSFFYSNNIKKFYKVQKYKKKFASTTMDLTQL